MCHATLASTRPAGLPSRWGIAASAAADGRRPPAEDRRWPGHL